MNDAVTAKSTPNPTLNLCSRARGISVCLGVLSATTPARFRFINPQAATLCFLSVCTAATVLTKDNIVTVSEVGYPVRNIRPVIMSDSWEVKQPTVTDKRRSKTARSELTRGYLLVSPHAHSLLFSWPTKRHFFKPSASSPNKCALPPLGVGPVHLSEISLHAKTCVFFHILPFTLSISFRFVVMKAMTTYIHTLDFF